MQNFIKQLGLSEYGSVARNERNAIKAFWKWLMSPCTEHPDGVIADTKHPTADHRYPLIQTYPKHKYLCPTCMKELEDVIK